MNKDLFDSKWKQFRGETSSWWSLINTSDLEKVDKADVKFDKIVTMLQVKYGYSRDLARKEIEKHVNEFEARQKTGL
jgi:hypothetical protein